MDELKTDYDRADCLVNILIDRATAQITDEETFQALRTYFMSQDSQAKLLPSWFARQRSLERFWRYIKNKFDTYAERRAFLWSEFEKLLAYCEKGEQFPAETDISEGLTSFDRSSVNRAWRSMIRRQDNDPEGAITAARSLLESVCKHILDELGIVYDAGKVELPKLYKSVAKELNLSPSQHAEPLFKQILGGCSSIVNGLGSIRNKLGDAHGKGQKHVRPTSRHARLAVNLAGAMALFLVETYLKRYEEK
ncbi:MAG: abortive infection family protein [Bacteroidales bacterium]|nr:abortive infection family protein [Candidatus Latescibacterota bacterium]